MPLPSRVFGRRACAALPEEVEARRISERQFIKKNDTTTSNVWYLIDARWLTSWKTFLCDGGDIPGPISNRSLLDTNGRPLSGLIAAEHYRGVNSAVWLFLLQQYGGGPALTRQSLDIYSNSAEDTSSVGSPESVKSAASMSSCLPSRGSSFFKSSANLSVPAVLRRLSRSRSSSKTRALKLPPTAPRALGVSSTNNEKENQDENRAGQVFFISQVDARIVEQPKDGSCLFHSIAYGLKERVDPAQLRQHICAFMLEHPDTLVAGTTIEDWVRHDRGVDLGSYVKDIADGGWGGGIEMEVATKVNWVNVHVYEHADGGYRRIADFNSGSEYAETVNILYQGRNHYDALVVAKGSGRWLPRLS